MRTSQKLLTFFFRDLTGGSPDQQLLGSVFLVQYFFCVRFQNLESLCEHNKSGLLESTNFDMRR